MQSTIEAIPLEKLKANPANPNRMSKSNFAKLVAHIKRTGRYEPIVVRPHPQEKNKYEIINGHHRCGALRRLGRPKAQCIVWDVDRHEADLLLTTLNRLSGRDDIHKRSELISRLAGQLDTKQLSRLLPESKKQIERLRQLAIQKQPVIRPAEPGKQLATAVVFFLTEQQKALLDKAMAIAVKGTPEKLPASQRKAEALTEIVKVFMTQNKQPEEQV